MLLEVFFFEFWLDVDHWGALNHEMPRCVCVGNHISLAPSLGLYLNCASNNSTLAFFQFFSFLVFDYGVCRIFKLTS